jgi:hypothetical protein
MLTQHNVSELRQEIAVWQRAAASLSSYSKDEDTVRGSLLKKVRRLVQELKRKLVTGRYKQFSCCNVPLKQQRFNLLQSQKHFYSSLNP